MWGGTSYDNALQLSPTAAEIKIPPAARSPVTEKRNPLKYEAIRYITLNRFNVRQLHFIRSVREITVFIIRGKQSEMRYVYPTKLVVQIFNIWHNKNNNESFSYKAGCSWCQCIQVVNFQPHVVLLRTVAINENYGRIQLKSSFIFNFSLLFGQFFFI